MGFKYVQHDNYDKYQTEDENGNTTHRGKTVYDEDGTMKRWDNISPASNESDYHYHEWMNKKNDGSYEYGAEKHKNH